MEKNNDRDKRYIYDALYDIIYLPDFIWNIISCPELQHLREVRLCDINSLCLTGGANINRYEHAIGTCYLANECIKSWPEQIPLKKEEERQLLLAALLHDVVQAAFGHSVEHIVSKEGFSPEESFADLILEKTNRPYKYKLATFEPIFFGMPKELVHRISEADIEAIDEIIKGKGKFGPLINGKMDLDNLDNVFRLAYHIGIVRSGEVPLKIAKSLWVENGRLIIREEALAEVRKWYDIRRRLYSFLLLNPEEFSGKCMLREAIELAKMRNKHALSWYVTDYALLLQLFKTPLARLEVKQYLFSLAFHFREELNKGILSKNLLNAFKQKDAKLSSSATVEKGTSGWRIRSQARNYFIEDKKNELSVYRVTVRGEDISKIVQRLMKGELYGCIGIFSTSRIEKSEMLGNTNKRRDLEDGLSQAVKEKFGKTFKYVKVALHLIKDVDKTRRKVTLWTDTGRFVEIGESSKQLLIGVFFKNPGLNMYKIDHNTETIRRIKERVKNYLRDSLQAPNLDEVQLYAEAN